MCLIAFASKPCALCSFELCRCPLPHPPITISRIPGVGAQQLLASRLCLCALSFVPFLPGLSALLCCSSLRYLPSGPCLCGSSFSPWAPSPWWATPGREAGMRGTGPYLLRQPNRTERPATAKPEPSQEELPHNRAKKDSAPQVLRCTLSQNGYGAPCTLPAL